MNSLKIRKFLVVFGAWKNAKTRNVVPYVSYFRCFGALENLKIRNVAPYIACFCGFCGKPPKSETSPPTFLILRGVGVGLGVGGGVGELSQNMNSPLRFLFLVLLGRG